MIPPKNGHSAEGSKPAKLEENLTIKERIANLEKAAGVKIETTKIAQEAIDKTSNAIPRRRSLIGKIKHLFQSIKRKFSRTSTQENQENSPIPDPHAQPQNIRPRPLPQSSKSVLFDDSSKNLSEEETVGRQEAESIKEKSEVELSKYDMTWKEFQNTEISAIQSFIDLNKDLTKMQNSKNLNSKHKKLLKNYQDNIFPKGRLEMLQNLLLRFSTDSNSVKNILLNDTDSLNSTYLKDYTEFLTQGALNVENLTKATTKILSKIRSKDKFSDETAVISTMMSKGIATAQRTPRQVLLTEELIKNAPSEDNTITTKLQSKLQLFKGNAGNVNEIQKNLQNQLELQKIPTYNKLIKYIKKLPSDSSTLDATQTLELIETQIDKKIKSKTERGIKKGHNLEKYRAIKEKISKLKVNQNQYQQIQNQINKLKAQQEQSEDIKNKTTESETLQKQYPASITFDLIKKTIL